MKQFDNEDDYDEWVYSIAQTAIEMDETASQAAKVCIVATENVGDEKALLGGAEPFEQTRAWPSDVISYGGGAYFDADQPDDLRDLAVDILKTDIQTAKIEHERTRSDGGQEVQGAVESVVDELVAAVKQGAVSEPGTDRVFTPDEPALAAYHAVLSGTEEWSTDIHKSPLDVLDALGTDVPNEWHGIFRDAHPENEPDSEIALEKMAQRKLEEEVAERLEELNDD